MLTSPKLIDPFQIALGMHELCLVEVVVETPESTRRMSDAKQTIRERVWELLQGGRGGTVPGRSGRIPNFRGAAGHRGSSGRIWTRPRSPRSRPWPVYTR